MQKEDSQELRLEVNLERKKAKTLEKKIRIKDKTLAETTALLVLKKVAFDFRRTRGRLIQLEHRIEIITLIKEAYSNGSFAYTCM